MLSDGQTSRMVRDALCDNRKKYIQDISSEDHKARVNKNALPDVDAKGRMKNEAFSAQVATQYGLLKAAGCPEDLSREIIQVVEEFPKLFDGDLSKPSTLEPYVVELRDDCGEPPCAKARPLPRERREWLDVATKNLEKIGVIDWLGGSKAASVNPMYLNATGSRQQEGISTSPVVLAKKPGEEGKISWRLCIDLVKENLRHKKATYRSPTLQDLREVAQDSNSFFVLDLMKGYFQIPLAEQSKKHFVFVCPLGEGNAKFQLNRVPMGGLNSAPHLQACMERLLGDLSGIGCYQDDILGCAKTGGSHVEKLRSVFSRLEGKGLKLQLEKVILWAREVVFVGHKFTEAGCTADPSKVAALVGLERPETIKELSLFAHSSGFLRPYVLRFAELTAPLTNVINDALKECPKNGIKRTRAKAKRVNWDIPGLDEA